MESNKTLAEIMSTEVISIHEDDNIRIVNNTFAKHSFHHIPITNTSGRVVGMISKEDLLRLSSIRDAFTQKEFNQLKVSAFMTRNITTLLPENSIQMAANIFMANTFHAIPIVQNNKLIGIVTTHDLIKEAYKL